MTREDTLTRVRELGLVAVVRGPSSESALEVVEALIDGGVLGIEVTFTIPDAESMIAELGRRHGDRIVLGAGTITSPEQAESAAGSGATYLVSPGTDREVVGVMRETGLPVMTGALTPTEVMLADGLGVDAVKLFPGSLGGPDYLKALRGPFPDVPILPTGGVSRDNVRDWFAAGAFAVGVGGALVPPALGAVGRDGVVARARAMVNAVQAAMRDAPRPVAPARAG